MSSSWAAALVMCRRGWPRAGGHAVGLDNSAQQLATARRMQDELGLWFPLVQADGEHIPFADARFDLIISEYGASIWCDPYRWVA